MKNHFYATPRSAHVIATATPSIWKRCLHFSLVIWDAFQTWKELLVQAIERLDSYLSPATPWRYVGQEDVLYESVIDLRGFQFVAQLALDAKTVADTFGTFSNELRPGGIRCQDGRYFYPTITEEQRYLALSCRSVPEHQARCTARHDLANDLVRASLFGRTWFLYRLTVIVKRGNLKLAKVDLRGIEADPDLFQMDPCIDQLTSELILDAERDAISVIGRMRPVSLGMKVGA